jgi:4-carboxymuconolactone decarboxylase
VRNGETNTESAPAQNFTGSAQVQRLFQPVEPSRLSGGLVTFQPGARTNWHIHPLGQTLIVTAGTGWIQQFGERVQEMRVGDVVQIPAGVKHWHGATDKTPLTHIAVQEQSDGKTVEWLEKVSDPQYLAGKSL